MNSPVSGWHWDGSEADDELFETHGWMQGESADRGTSGDWFWWLFSRAKTNSNLIGGSGHKKRSPLDVLSVRTYTHLITDLESSRILRITSKWQKSSADVLLGSGFAVGSRTFQSILCTYFSSSWTSA